MKKAKVFVNNLYTGDLIEVQPNKEYRFVYLPDYAGPSVSLEMPVTNKVYSYDRFPPFFEGLLPEGMMLEGLLKQAKIDRNDYMAQIIKVGKDLVGNVTVEPYNE